MRVLRKQQLKISAKDLLVGDQIIVPLTGFGKFIATVQQKDKNSVLLLFDECIVRKPMNEANSNKGGFEASDLCKWLKTDLLAAFPDYIRDRILNISVPTYGQIFGHDDIYEKHIEADTDEQLPLMRDSKNRIACYKNDTEWYWLSNTVRDSAAYFADVDTGGTTTCYYASVSLGVRPAFLLKIS